MLWMQPGLILNSPVEKTGWAVAKTRSQSARNAAADSGVLMEAALESAGIVFTNGNEPGVRLRKARKKMITEDGGIVPPKS